MKKTVEISIDLYPDDIADYMKYGNVIQQEAVLYKLSKEHYNNTAEFKKALKNIRHSIEEDYNHDVRNNIKNMIKDIYKVFWEVD